MLFAFAEGKFESFNKCVRLSLEEITGKGKFLDLVAKVKNNKPEQVLVSDADTSNFANFASSLSFQHKASKLDKLGQLQISKPMKRINLSIIGKL